MLAVTPGSIVLPTRGRVGRRFRYRWNTFRCPPPNGPVPAVRGGGGSIALSPDGKILYACFNNRQVFAARVEDWKWHELTDARFTGRLVPLVRVSPFAQRDMELGLDRHRILVGTEPGSSAREAMVEWPAHGAPSVRWRESAPLAEIPEHGVYTNYVLWSYAAEFAPQSWNQGEIAWVSGGHSLYSAVLGAWNEKANWEERYSRPISRTKDGTPTYTTRGFDNFYLWEVEKHGSYIVQSLADMFMFESYDGGEAGFGGNAQRSASNPLLAIAAIRRRSSGPSPRSCWCAPWAN